MGAIRHAGFRLSGAIVQQRPAPMEREHREDRLNWPPSRVKAYQRWSAYTAARRAAQADQSDRPANVIDILDGATRVAAHIAPREPVSPEQLRAEMEEDRRVWALLYGHQWPSPGGPV